MLVEKLSYLSRRDLSVILRTLQESPKGRRTKRELEAQVVVALAKFLSCSPMEVEERLIEELAKILKVQLPEDRRLWPGVLQESMSDRLYKEFLPFVQVAIGVAWADGDFTQQEVEYLDLLFSGFKMLRKYRRYIPDLAAEPMSPDGFKRMFEKLSKDKIRWILAFGWAMACADGKVHPKERVFLDKIASLTSLDRKERDAIRDEILEKWTVALNEHGDPFEAAFRAVDFERILQGHVGINPLELLRPRAWERRRLLKRSHSAILSLTIFSKAGLITGRELTHRDRILLLFALVLLEA